MKLFSATAALLLAGSSLVFAAQENAVQPGESGASSWVQQLDGDYVLVTPGKGNSTKASITPYDEFVAAHGGGDASSTRGSDGGEDIVPTPGAPGTGIGSEAGDEVVFNRSSGGYSRVTVYVYQGSGIWMMRSNILKMPPLQTNPM